MSRIDQWREREERTQRLDSKVRDTLRRWKQDLSPKDCDSMHLLNKQCLARQQSGSYQHYRRKEKL